mmetsp:Transcript_58156/g.114394  ORF Transcript_58156/g.114394 Transcript_58156/m.114394 type:complete len:206 (-) Transcript_58156:466-1083(-)
MRLSFLGRPLGRLSDKGRRIALFMRLECRLMSAAEGSRNSTSLNCRCQPAVVDLGSMRGTTLTPFAFAAECTCAHGRPETTMQPASQAFALMFFTSLRMTFAVRLGSPSRGTRATSRAVSSNLTPVIREAAIATTFCCSATRGGRGVVHDMARPLARLKRPCSDFTASEKEAARWSPRSKRSALFSDSAVELPLIPYEPPLTIGY